MNRRLETLPIDHALTGIVQALTTAPGLVISAPPGAGKTTRVPRALYDAGFAGDGEILVLEPRRLAARLAAARVAAELGEEPGGTVGFSIRFESVAGPATRIRFITEAILSRRIVRDPVLAGVSTVILDEFHERHIATDLALSFLRHLQRTRRPDLKIAVMSATLESEPVAEFLGGVPILAVAGTRFDVTVDYEARESREPLQEKVTGAVSRLLREGIDGDLLVFLPGAAEIRLAAAALKATAARGGWITLPLHGDLPAAAQARVVEPAPQRKVILATNVAETSVTIPGVAAVVDSGLARVAGYSAWNGIPVLSLAKISKSSAIQRAGRAGRTRAGRVLRLYTKHDFASRPERDIPEIMRADLSETLLTLHGAGIRDAGAFPWFAPPPKPALQAAESLLQQLGALTGEGKLTEAGDRMLRFPLHPRLARLVVTGETLGVAQQACLLAALLGERDIRLEVRSDIRTDMISRGARTTGSSDLLEAFERFREAETARFAPERIRSLGLDQGAVRSVDRAHRQILKVAGRTRNAAQDKEEALLQAVLAAFPDRVARRRGPGSREFLLAAGGTGKLAETSVVQLAPLIVAVDAEARTGRKGTRDNTGVLIRSASAIEPEWLAGWFPDEITSRRSLLWNEAGGRVDEIAQTCYRDLVLEETARPAPRTEETAGILFAQASSIGLAAFQDGAEVPSLQTRIALVAHQFPSSGLRELDAERIAEACTTCCAAKRSLAELAQVSLIGAIMARLTPEHRALLAAQAPERITLPGGRKVPIHYEAGRPPWIESRLQDFVGLKTTPTICSSRVPLTVHLLAPNRRPVQVTQDLPGFWERHYPALRRQLQRRYPRHFWPE